MTTAPLVKYCQSFKKYRAEFRAEVVQYARDWAKTQQLITTHEDASIFKITASKEQIEVLLAQIKDKFGWIPPTPAE